MTSVGLLYVVLCLLPTPDVTPTLSSPLISTQSTDAPLASCLALYEQCKLEARLPTGYIRIDYSVSQMQVPLQSHVSSFWRLFLQYMTESYSVVTIYRLLMWSGFLYPRP